MNNIFGTASPHVIDMANAYATIAAQGKRATPYLITKVTSANGSVDYKVKKQLTPAFDQKVTADVTDAMTHVVTEGTGTGAGAGSPGCGQDRYDDQDNLAVWFDGFTPQLSAAVGIYQGNGTKTITVNNFGEVTGGTFPVDIWTAFMKGALQGQKVIDFPPRAGVGDNTLPPPRPTTDHRPDDSSDRPPTPVPTTTRPPDHLHQAPVRPRLGPTEPPGPRRQLRRTFTAALAPVGRSADGDPPPLPRSLATMSPHAPESVAPTRIDPVAAAASEIIGGPLGRYAAPARRAARSAWQPAAAVLVGLSSLTVAFGVLQKGHCFTKGWNNPDQFWHACYSDLPVSSGLGHAMPYLSGAPPLDQPLISGLVMWLVGLAVPDGSGWCSSSGTSRCGRC